MSDDVLDPAEVARLWAELADHDDDAPVHRDHARGPCSHGLVRLDPDAKRVYCRECGREVSAYDFLDKLAGEWHRWQRARDAIRTADGRGPLEARGAAPARAEREEPAQADRPRRGLYGPEAALGRGAGLPALS